MELFDFQKESVSQLLTGRHIIVSSCGSGKSAMAMSWAEQKCKETGKTKILVVTTASKCHARTAEGLNDFEADARLFCSPSFYNSLSSSLSLISWHKLRTWEQEHWSEVPDYVFVFDECLPADTKVKTQSGEKEIADLCVGDMVLSYNHDTRKLAYKKITRTIKKPSPNKMIRLLLADGTAIISTGNHQHYTQDGYKNAENVKIGDTLYETRAVCETKSDKRESRKIRGICGMRDLWSKNKCGNDHETSKRQIETGKENILFSGMWQSRHKREWEKSDDKHGTEGEVEENSYKKNGRKQLLQRQETYREGIGDKEEERVETDMGRTPRIKRWQWNILGTTKNIVGKTKQSKQRLGDGTACVARRMDERLSKELQVGCGEHILQDRDRVRWTKPQFSKDKGKGQEEGEEIRGVRVESIEVLKLRDIKRLGLYRDADNVYCIDVEDNHNFFANGILTHNCAKAGAGVSSGMGKTFLKITKRTNDWAGFTGTPGDTWLKFYPYFTACNLVRNKTTFLNVYANVQTYKGYPEIVGWRNEDRLREMWAAISYAPDTSQVMNELPRETHKVVEFKKPTSYNRVLKTRLNEDGEFLDTSGALVAELRRTCFTKEKQEWIKDFVENLEAGCVFFYNYINTGDKLEEIISKALPDGARVWRIDGKHHEIPTAETIGERDVVVCQWQSGSEALNLQFLHYWVAVELCYSYSTAIQGRGRIKRVGQKEPMFFYYLLTDDTIEQSILECLRSKGTFAEDTWCVKNNLIEEK